MTSLPSFPEAEALALFLDAEARNHDASARAIAMLDHPSLEAVKHAQVRAQSFSRAADLVYWLGTHSNRLRQFEDAP